jgi:hypothetical protein
VRVYVPFTKRLPEVEAAMADAEWEDVSWADGAYWSLLYRLWGEAEGAIIVEHDIVPTAEDLDGLQTCNREWCVCTYAFEEFGPIWGLGCVKFSPTLMLRTPNALADVARISDEVHPSRHWCSLDVYLQSVLRRANAVPHVHGEVRHLCPTRSHDCR